MVDVELCLGQPGDEGHGFEGSERPRGNLEAGVQAQDVWREAASINDRK